MADPYYNNVVLLLPFDEAASSTTFTDYSSTPKTVTAINDAVSSNGQTKYYTTSVHLPSVGATLEADNDLVSIASHADLTLGSDDFTIELWVYKTEADGNWYDLLVCEATVPGDNPWSWIIWGDDIGIQFNMGVGSDIVSPDGVGDTGILANEWTHVAVTRSGTTYRVFKNGFSGTPITKASHTNEAGIIYLGGTRSLGFDGEPFRGYVQDLRITKGVARYTSDFTPPTAFLETYANLPVSSLTWTTAAPLSIIGMYHVLPVDSLTWTPQVLSQAFPLPVTPLTWTTAAPLSIIGMYHVLPASALTWTAAAFDQIIAHTLPAATLTWTARALQFIIESPGVQQSRNLYRAYLTGDAETPPVADLELPLASWQSTRRNAEQTYLYIVVPNPVPYVDGINARLNGDIVIYSGFAIGDTETLTELLRVNFESFRYDLGARSGSAQLSGHKQVTYSNPKTRALSGISYKSVTDGIRRVRCEPDMWLNPGDTADLGDGETFVVDSLTYTINPRLALMEVAEVEA